MIPARNAVTYLSRRHKFKRDLVAGGFLELRSNMLERIARRFRTQHLDLAGACRSRRNRQSDCANTQKIKAHDVSPQRQTLRLRSGVAGFARQHTRLNAEFL